MGEGHELGAPKPAGGLPLAPPDPEHHPRSRLTLTTCPGLGGPAACRALTEPPQPLSCLLLLEHATKALQASHRMPHDRVLEWPLTPSQSSKSGPFLPYPGALRRHRTLPDPSAVAFAGSPLEMLFLCAQSRGGWLFPNLIADCPPGHCWPPSTPSPSLSWPR